MRYPLPHQYVLPDPWVATGDLDVYGGACMMARAGIYASATWPSADLAIGVPVIFPVNATVYALYALLNTANDNYDLGFYNEDLTAIARKGSTAVPASGTVTLSLPDYRVKAGYLYYMVLVMNGTTSAFFRNTYTSDLGPTAFGAFAAATSFPLPDPIVPGPGAGTSFPLFAFGVR